MNLRIIFWRRESFDGGRTKSHRNNREATDRCWEVARDTWTILELQKPWSKRNTLTQSETVKGDVIVLKPDRKEPCSLHIRGLIIMLHFLNFVFFMANICIRPFILHIIWEVLLSFIRGRCTKSFYPCYTWKQGRTLTFSLYDEETYLEPLLLVQTWYFSLRNGALRKWSKRLP